jgi:tetratricopeptide (TPR) repeat protein
MAWNAGLIDLDEVSVTDERLRDVPRDEEVVVSAVVQARARLAKAHLRGDIGLQQDLLGYLGNACRLLGQADEAIALLTDGLKLALSTDDARRSVVATIRLGEAYRCRGEYSTAETLFREALARTQTAPEFAWLEDFALQHLGKCLLDQADFVAAVQCLERALALRQAKADQQLVASTERALAKARQHAAAVLVHDGRNDRPKLSC